MPPQSRTAQGFAGAAVEIDLIHKGIMTIYGLKKFSHSSQVEIDLIRKGIMTSAKVTGHLPTF